MTLEQLKAIKDNQQLSAVNSRINDLDFGAPRYQSTLNWCCDRLDWLHKFKPEFRDLTLVLVDKICEVMNGTYEGDPE